jgi:signal transduction histidine kinase
VNLRFKITLRLMVRSAQAGVFIFLVAFAISAISQTATNEVLTSAAAVLSLTPDQAARSIPVSVTGVVTLAEADWGGRFFVQDSSSGVFVNCKTDPPPNLGDVVHVGGVSDPGNYSPVITSANWKKVATAPLPQAKPVSVERFMSGAEDGQRVELSGVVRSAQAEQVRIALELESGGYRFHAFAPSSAKVDLNSLLGARVHVRGTAAVSAESKRASKPSVNLFVPQPSDLMIDRTPAKAVTSEPLGTAAELLALTTDQAARGIHLSITGLVTAAEPNWAGSFFVQDLTGGVFVNNRNGPQPVLGDLVEVAGVSHAGGYAPDVMESHWKKIGTAPLPEAKPVSVERLMSGAEHGRRVEVSGIVRSAHPSESVGSRLAVELSSGGYRFWAFPPLPAMADPNSLVGATVRLRGTAAASFIQPLRRALAVKMFVPRQSDFLVEELPGTAILQKSLTPLSSIAEYRQNGSSEPRIRVKGMVTYQRPGEDIFLHDETGSLRVKCGETNPFAPGEIVEAIGFASSERFLPVLEDAALIRTRKFEKPIAPQKVTVRELLEGFHQADLISLQGKLLDSSLRGLRTAHALSNAPAADILTLQNGAYFFTARAPATTQFAELAPVPIGSTLEVSGICMLQPDEQGKMESAQILLPDAASLRILQRPNWWTPRRLLTGLGLLVAVSLVGFNWTIMILRRNSALKLSVAQNIKAQQELQKAHDLLESRVAERTKELKFEMSARKEAEVQCQAVMAERRRIAQELHDTLLQGFTSLGLKLDTVTNGLPPSLAGTREQLQKILARSDEYLVEARRAVWELRSPSLDKLGDFAEALKTVSERALQGTGIRLNFSVEGTARNTEHNIEGNLLRICEEAVANAVKHAHPTQVDVQLLYTVKEIQLRIRDNGCGFNPDGPDGSKEGHFGLVGIRERARSVAGNVSLNSQPGQGTEIIVRL